MGNPLLFPKGLFYLMGAGDTLFHPIEVKITPVLSNKEWVGGETGVPPNLSPHRMKQGYPLPCWIKQGYPLHPLDETGYPLPQLKETVTAHWMKLKLPSKGSEVAQPWYHSNSNSSHPSMDKRRSSNTAKSFFSFSQKKFLDDTCPFCGATDTHVVDFWWYLPWVFKARVDFSLAHFLVCVLFLTFTSGAIPADCIVSSTAKPFWPTSL